MTRVLHRAVVLFASSLTTVTAFCVVSLVMAFWPVLLFWMSFETWMIGYTVACRSGLSSSRMHFWFATG